MADPTPGLLLATNNPGKVREMRALLEPRGWRVLAPADRGLSLDPEETGETYAENALIKARAFAAAAGMTAIADDSGLEVDALDGRPGVHSARYGGPDLSFTQRIDLLLSELKGQPDERRGARFRSVIAIVVPDGRQWLTNGSLEGRIGLAPRGAGGFGYDPIFVLAGRRETMAEVTEAEKNRISHRAIAVQQALSVLDKLRADPALP